MTYYCLTERMNPVHDAIHGDGWNGWWAEQMFDACQGGGVNTILWLRDTTAPNRETTCDNGRRATIVTTRAALPQRPPNG